MHWHWRVCSASWQMNGRGLRRWPRPSGVRPAVSVQPDAADGGGACRGPADRGCPGLTAARSGPGEIRQHLRLVFRSYAAAACHAARGETSGSLSLSLARVMRPGCCHGNGQAAIASFTRSGFEAAVATHVSSEVGAGGRAELASGTNSRRSGLGCGGKVARGTCGRQRVRGERRRVEACSGAAVCDPSGRVSERSVPLVLLREHLCAGEAALGAALLAEDPSHGSVEHVGVHGVPARQMLPAERPADRSSGRFPRRGAVAGLTTSEARTGACFPFRRSGGTSANSNPPAADARARGPTMTDIGSAADCRRAAVFITSPAANPWPRATSRTNASPVSTATRTCRPISSERTRSTMSRAALTARSGSSSCASGKPNSAATGSPMNFSIVPHSARSPRAGARSNAKQPVDLFRIRPSASSVDPTRSQNSAVTTRRSGVASASSRRAPHLLQNSASAGTTAPQARQFTGCSCVKATDHTPTRRQRRPCRSKTTRKYMP